MRSKEEKRERAVLLEGQLALDLCDKAVQESADGNNAKGQLALDLREGAGGAPTAEGGEGLSKEERRALLKRMVEIESLLLRKKEGNALSRYNKGRVHKKQMLFHKCKKRNRWVFGGNRTGKTECGAVECIWLARGIHPYKKNKPNTSGWVVSLSTQVQRDVAQAKILSYLPEEWIADTVMASGRKGSPGYGVIDTLLIRNVFGGISRIGFKTCDQGREKFQGASLDYVWFDEEPPRDVYEECRMRVMDREGEIFGTMTPLKGLTFLYEDIYLNTKQDKEAWCIFFSWEDNPFLSAKEKRYLSASMSEEQKESRKYGRFYTNSGLVYPEFQADVHVIEPFSVPREWYDKISIDPGLKNPLSCHFYACDYDGNVYVIAEHYEAEKDVAHHASRIRELAASLGWHTDYKGRLHALIDSAAGQRTLASSKSVAELFYDHGILTSREVNKDLFSGIARVKEYLKGEAGRPRLFIFKSCVNLIREIKGYWWGEGDNPIKRDDHALDELRYYIMSRPEPPKKELIKSEITRDKERLYRRLRKRLR